MSLRADRVTLLWGLVLLAQHAKALGLEAALDMAKRCPECRVGKANSLHKEGRAFDLLIYRDVDGDGDQDYLTGTEDHRPLGEYWESLHPRFRWGGRFNDGNHYEIVPEGAA